MAKTRGTRSTDQSELIANRQRLTCNYQAAIANYQLRVAAVLPSYKTELFIADVVSKAKKYVDQVVVIDDGSPDGTAEVARSAGALVISCNANLGKGSAMKIAMQNTDADIIVFLDSDGQHDPEDIPKLITPIAEGKADLVIGSRWLPESKTLTCPLVRRLSNKLASFIISAIISFLLPLVTFVNRPIQPSEPAQQRNKYRLTATRLKRVTDCTSGFKAIKGESWQKLHLVSSRFEIDTEIIYEAAKNKLVIKEVPISCSWNSEVSSLSIPQDGLRTLRLLARKLLDDARNKGR